MSNFDFVTLFKEFILEHNPKFEIKGLIAKDKRIYPFGNDTKVLSTIFEMLIRPFVYEFAQMYGYKVYEPEQQNFYPDFTLLKSASDREKIAFDIKTTYKDYKKDGTWRANFTLGSYASFMRSKTKNIAFHYDHYSNHYIMGFVYDRCVKQDINIYNYQEIDKIPLSFTNVEYFVQEKYKIAGDIPGSGNTENIGSIVASSIRDFEEGKSPFTDLGHEVFEEYWIGYPKYKEKSTANYTNFNEFMRYSGRT